MIRTLSESRLIHAIYGAAADPGQWPKTLTLASDFVGATGAIIAYHQHSGVGDFLIPGRVDEALSARYLTHHHTNLWSNVLGKQPAHQVVQLRRLVRHDEVKRTAFFHEILLPQGLVDSVAWVEPSLSNDGAGGFAFQLNEAQSADAPIIMKRLTRVTGHLSRALQLTVRLSAGNSASRLLPAVLDLLPQLAWLLNSGGSIIHANGRAEEALRDRDGFCVSSDGRRTLTATSAKHAHALAQAITQASAVAAGSTGVAAGPGPIRVERTRGRGIFAICVVPLPPASFEMWRTEGAARVLVLAYRAAEPQPETRVMLKRLFGLTPAEAQVAVRIGAGLSRAETAAQMSISKETIKTHMRRCFAKTNLRSSAQLANLVSTLTAVPRE